MSTTNRGRMNETFNLSRENLNKVMEKIGELIREGNVRNLIVKNAQGQTLLVVPLTVGVVGAALLPIWAAIGAVAALVADCTIEVEKRTDA
ncbi:MAG TPA: DUF4342 domain-containing protein [Candidatus Dormibacteraeota bacterium]|nr:DUF4342 domain-containing protein [Candidatus Dormibacteraeota bacterium]